jgi:hypothetical protein
MSKEMFLPSDLFSKAFAYCKKKYNQVAILSAKYGLVFPDDVIEPYDKTLNKMSIRERKDWSRKVFKQMRERLNLSAYGTVYFHAGKNYREFLIPKLNSFSLKCEVPLNNLPIGKQLRWYKEHDC